MTTAAPQETRSATVAALRRAGLVLLTSTIGLSALLGGVELIRGAWDLPVAWLRPLPLDSWVLPGIALIVVVAVPMLAAALAVYRRHRFGPEAAIVAGLALVGWILVQLLVIGPSMWLQPVMLGLGVVVTLLGLSQRRVEDAAS